MQTKQIRAKNGNAVPADRLNGRLRRPRIDYFGGRDPRELAFAPREEFVRACRDLIREKQITTRNEFSRFATSDVLRAVRSDPVLWSEIGLEDGRRPGSAAKKALARASAIENGTTLSEEAGGLAAQAPPSASCADGHGCGPEPEADEELFSLLDEDEASQVQAYFSSNFRRPSQLPPPPYLFKDWNAASPEERGALRKRLFSAAVSGPVAEVCAMLNKGIPLDIRDEVGRPFFIFVAEQGRTALLRELVNYMDDVDMRNSKGDTMLMACAECGHSGAVRMLLGLNQEKKPDLNARNRKKRTALMLAAWEGHIEVVRQLRNAGAAYTLKDAYKRTANHYAKLGGHEEVAASLVPRKRKTKN